MAKKSTEKPFRRPLSELREPYLAAFLVSFAMMLALALPVMIYTGGYFTYYGDFNSQQLPFYYLAHDAVRSGSFGWNWQTDLGANFIGSYSFYLLGSPFFWLSVPFPQSWVLYLIPWLLALKHAVAALTAFAYIRRFVRSRQAAFIGALLYAFSGFQMYNVFFNHFQDVTAFFPLVLLAMEQRVNENRRGVFALSVALMGLINYYFYSGIAVFAVFYFFIRCTSKDFHANVRKFFSIALEAVLGTAMACVIMLPAALAVLDNYRVHNHFFGMDMVTYSDRTRIWRIIQSFFMIPDNPARPNLFQSDYGKWSSIAGYLPMFSMAGVIAFMTQKRKHWATKIIVFCIICAFIPILNSMFYTFNSSYYARWFYMPVLIMAMMTAYALDDPKIKWKGGLTVCAVMDIAFIVMSFLPKKNSEDKLVFADFAAYPQYLWITVCGSLLMLYFAIVVAATRRKNRGTLRLGLVLTAFSCLFTGGCMMYFGIIIGANPTAYLNTSIRAKNDINTTVTEANEYLAKNYSIRNPEDQFFRVDTSPDYDNYPMFWGYSNMRCFHSIVPPSVMDFYDAIGITRDVASRADTSNYPLRELFSVKYYFDHETPEESTVGELKTFRLYEQANSFRVYENDAYIPMGIAYDYYISREEFDKLTNLTKEKTMLKALVLDEAQIQAYAGVLTEMPASERMAMDDDAFTAYCEARAADTCDTFTYNSYGFKAAISLDQPKMVFFSVPYEKGWRAEVNGKPVTAERANIGFMAVPCEAGDNTITFRYETPGLKVGAITAVGALGVLILYLLLTAMFDKGVRPAYAKQKHSYDYDGLNLMSDHLRYLGHAALRQTAPPRRKKREDAE